MSNEEMKTKTCKELVSSVCKFLLQRKYSLSEQSQFIDCYNSNLILIQENFNVIKTIYNK
jgi:hypothetical protein